jgi:SpoVK/Ycf46/Vps4 family AAA+-type ATPase
VCLVLTKHCCKIRATDILNQWLGGSEATIRAIFARARSAAPCALFFDELDAIAANREDDGDSNDVYARLLSTLLNEIDGVNSNHNTPKSLLIVGTTNRIKAIDAALLRPGRFEEHLLLDLPSTNDIEEMLKMFLVNVPIAPRVNFHNIAELLKELNASAADVKGLCTDVCLHAMGKVNESTNISEIMVHDHDFDDVINRWKQ